MAQVIEAIYTHGVLKPATDLNLREEQQVATVSAFLTVGFSDPHIPNHRGARTSSQISAFAKKNPRSGKR